MATNSQQGTQNIDNAHRHRAPRRCQALQAPHDAIGLPNGSTFGRSIAGIEDDAVPGSGKDLLLLLTSPTARW